MDLGALTLATGSEPTIAAQPLPPIPSLDELMATLEHTAANTRVTLVGPPPPLRKRKIGKFLYLPVEISARELAGRAKIAGEMARRGWQVLIGASWNMMHHRYGDLPPGIVLFKTLNCLDAKGIFQAANYGHITACLNEEIMVMPDEPDLFRLNIDDNALTLVDHVFAHSEGSARILREMAPGKVVVTGAPRRVERQAFLPDGDIVVCTQAGTVNNALSYEKYIQTLFQTIGKLIDEPVMRITREQIQQECAHYQTMVDVAKALTDRYGPRVKLRPHPAEHIRRYSDEGLNINYGNSFSDQLTKTSVVIFVSGCGTGLEATVAGVPSVRIGNGGFGKSRDYGIPAASVADVLASVDVILQGHTPVEDASQDLAPLTISDTLHSVWQQNQYPMPFSIDHAWKHARTDQYSPTFFQAAKFPEVSDDKLSALCGAKVTNLDWRMWSIAA